MKQILITLITLVIVSNLYGQTCKYDSIFTYEFKDISSEEIIQIDIDQEIPVSIDIIDHQLKIKTIINNHYMKFEEVYHYYYDNDSNLKLRVDSSWITGSSEIVVDSIRFNYVENKLMQKIEYRNSSTFYPIVRYTYEYTNDTIIESKDYGRNMTIYKKSIYTDDDLISKEVMCNINKNGYTLQKFDIHNEMFSISSCDNEDKCNIIQNRFTKYDECDRLIEKKAQYEGKSIYYNYKTFVYK